MCVLATGLKCWFINRMMLAYSSLQNIGSQYGRRVFSFFFFNIIWPPELLEFMDEGVPILHRKPTFAHHHDSHGDVVVCTIEVCVPETVAEVESMTAFTLLAVLTHLCGTLHVKYARLSLVVLNQLSKNPLPVTLATQLITYGKVPVPVE